VEYSDRQAIEALIPADAPTRPRAIAVLDGVLTGQILTDGASRPAWALVVETADGTVFCGGEPSAEAARGALASVTTRSGDFIFGFNGPEDPVRRLLPPGPYYEGRAIDFTDRIAPPDEAELLAQAAPDGLRLVELDAHLLPRTAWAEDTIHAFGSTEAWSERGIGRCLLDEDEVVAQGMAGPRTRGVLEMSVWTRPSHWRHGLGTLVSLHAAAACEARGDAVWWNTNADNVGSIGIARRIGFTTERRYDLLAYRTSDWPRG
jgi:GNAT superfamily N-acetyltransferase